MNSYNMGEAKTIMVRFFHSCILRPSLVLSALLSLVTTVNTYFVPSQNMYGEREKKQGNKASIVRQLEEKTHTGKGSSRCW